MYIPRPVNDIQAFMSELPEASFVAGDKIIWSCRQIKSALEIERMEQAGAINRQALTAVVHGYRPGMTEWDVGNLFICEAYQRGAEWVAVGHIACGSRKGCLIQSTAMKV
jgi:Xaa-Pro aminopeptidase